MAAFHNGKNGLLNPGFVNTANLNVGVSACKSTGTHLFRIAKDGEIGIVCRENELHIFFERPNQLNDMLKDGLDTALKVKRPHPRVNLSLDYLAGQAICAIVLELPAQSGVQMEVRPHPPTPVSEETQYFSHNFPPSATLL